MAALAFTAIAATPPPDSGALRLDWLDTTVSPADDFYHYANGGWQAQNPIPPAYGRWSTFDVLREHTQEVVRGILEKAAADRSAAPGSIEQKIGDFYASGMDEDAVDAAGVTPLGDELSRVAAITGAEDLGHEIAHLQMIGVGAAFSFGEMTDFADSTRSIGVASQGGLGLPDRSYYLDPDFATARAEYVAHVARTLQLVGDSADDASREASAIMALETALAKASLSRAAMRDPHAIYNPMKVEAIDQLTPGFSWEAFLADVGRPDVKILNIATPAFFSALNLAIEAAPVDTWKAYLRWQLAGRLRAVPLQALPGRVLPHACGADRARRRCARAGSGCQNAEDEALGFAVGQKYVEEAFPPSAKASAIALLHGIRDALPHDLATLSWMGPATREAALAEARADGRAHRLPRQVARLLGADASTAGRGRST